MNTERMNLGTSNYQQEKFWHHLDKWKYE